jgi:flagellin-like protein
MKAWGNIRHKLFYFLRSAPEGFSPVVGSLLLLLITFLLVGAVISSLNLSGSRANLQPPVANIDLESCEGGLYNVGPVSKWVTFKENQIVLMHEGGDSLSLDSISIRITGYGNSFQGNISNGTGKRIEGDIEILYVDLSSKGKNPLYYPVNNNATLGDNSWDVGERLVLCGQDSAVGTLKSSVKVSVGGNANTYDNYGFKQGTEITLKIIDLKGRNVIAERKATVQPPD